MVDWGRRKGGVKIDLNRKKSVISPGRWHLPGEMTFLYRNVYRVFVAIETCGHRHCANLVPSCLVLRKGYTTRVYCTAGEIDRHYYI